MGRWPGGAPACAVCRLQLPQAAATEHETDFILLADIFPNGYHGCELAQVSPGNTVAVYGGGPVGLMAPYSALLRGAAKVFVVDRIAERLQKAEQIGAIPINFAEGNPVEQIKEQTDGEGTDKGVDAVGYQAQAGAEEREEPAIVLNSLIDTVRATGMLGVPGLYVPSDPRGPNEQAKRGMLLVSVGRFFEKGLRMGTGQCNVKRYNRYLRDLIMRAERLRASSYRTSCRWTRRPWHTRSSTSASRATPGLCCTRRGNRIGPRFDRAEGRTQARSPRLRG